MKNLNRRAGSKGFTLLEIVFSLALIVFLVTSILFVYIVSLRGWENLGHRTDLHEKLHFGLERMTRDLRESVRMDVSDHSVIFVLPTGISPNFYTFCIYYLYNPNDSWPPAYNQPSYELRRAVTGIGNIGSFTYGSGDTIITNLRPPAADTSITAAGNVLMIKLTAFEDDDQLTVQGYVHPRNIP